MPQESTPPKKVSFHTYLGRPHPKTGAPILQGAFVQFEKGQYYLPLGTNQEQVRIPVTPIREHNGPFRLMFGEIHWEKDKICIQQIQETKVDAKTLVILVEPDGPNHMLQITGAPNFQKCPFRNMKTRAKICSCGVKIDDEGFHPNKGFIAQQNPLDTQTCMELARGIAYGTSNTGVQFPYPMIWMLMYMGAKFSIVLNNHSDKIHHVSWTKDNRIVTFFGNILSTSDDAIELDGDESDIELF